MMPDTVLGWPASTLIGQPTECLVGDDGTGVPFNPFRPAVEMRRHRAWLRRADGRLALITVSATPLYGAAGQVIGARGIGVDMTDCDAQTSQIAERLRRGQLLHHIISRVGAGNRRRQHDGLGALGADPCPGRRGCGGDRRGIRGSRRSRCCTNAGPVRPPCWKPPPLWWCGRHPNQATPRTRTDARCWRSGARPASAPTPAWRSGAAPMRVPGIGRTRYWRGRRSVSCA